MATVTGLTAERMLEIEGESIVDAQLDVSGNLILTRFDGTQINVGPVRGPQGIQGIQGTPGVAGVSSIPGEIKAWPNDTLPLQSTYGKWVWADGAVYSATTYPIAASHIHANWKTAYGQSDPGAGNFRAPDLRGLVLAGMDAMPGGARANRMARTVSLTIAAKTGEETHIITVAEMPGHTHAFNGYLLQNVGTNTGYAGGGGDGVPGGTVSATGGGGAHENVQPTVFVPYIVRLDG